jgi:hypothetical protein
MRKALKNEAPKSILLCSLRANEIANQDSIENPQLLSKNEKVFCFWLTNKL